MTGAVKNCLTHMVGRDTNEMETRKRRRFPLPKSKEGKLCVTPTKGGERTAGHKGPFENSEAVPGEIYGHKTHQISKGNTRSQTKKRIGRARHNAWGGGRNVSL